MRNDPVTRKELDAFWHKARTIGEHPLRLWFIARPGFRDSTLRFGREQGILLSSQLNLQALAQRLGLRLGKCWVVNVVI